MGLSIFIGFLIFVNLNDPSLREGEKDYNFKTFFGVCKKKMKKKKEKADEDLLIE
jgi:hypothetical protein